MCTSGCLGVNKHVWSWTSIYCSVRIIPHGAQLLFYQKANCCVLVYLRNFCDHIYEINVENPQHLKEKVERDWVPGFGPVHPHWFFRSTSICQMSHCCPHQSFLAYKPIYFCTNVIPIFHFAKSTIGIIPIIKHANLAQISPSEEKNQ